MNSDLHDLDTWQPDSKECLIDVTFIISCSHEFS